jgi:hypothetical protein
MSLTFALLLATQTLSQRGFVDSGAAFYPQAAVNDSAHVVGEVLFRDEAFYKPRTDFQISGGIDLRTDTHHLVERSFHVSWADREVRRPLFSIRRLSAGYHRGGLHFEVGKQFVRWGRTDILNPTDRFAPHDFLIVVDKEFLGIVAARATYEKGSNTLDAVWSPRFTPSRVPLAGQRWFVVPPGVTLPSLETRIPDGPQYGFRWSRIGLVEFSAAYYHGFNDVPLFGLTYPKVRMIGGDAAVPLRWLTIKTEAGYFHFPNDSLLSASGIQLDDYVQYVIQLERQTGEWFLIGGYAGEFQTRRGNLPILFNPSRGIGRIVPWTRRLHHWSGSQCFRGIFGAAGRQRRVDKSGILSGIRTTLARYYQFYFDSRSSHGFYRAISSKFQRANRGKV